MPDSSSDPTSGLTPLGEATAGLHEMFLALIASDFTEWQACRVLGVMLAEQSRQS